MATLESVITGTMSMSRYAYGQTFDALRAPRSPSAFSPIFPAKRISPFAPTLTNNDTRHGDHCHLVNTGPARLGCP